MKIGVEHVAYPMCCNQCGKNWLACVEATSIEWSEDNIEYHHGDLLECPDCGHWNEIDRE